MTPAWESFPEVNRVLAGSLLALLVERMVRAADSSSRGERHGEAAPRSGLRARSSPGIVIGWRRRMSASPPRRRYRIMPSPPGCSTGWPSGRSCWDGRRHGCW